MTQSKLTAAQIHIGKPLQFDVFNSEGKLLLRRGIIIERASQLDQLVALGLFREGNHDDGQQSALDRLHLAVTSSEHRRPVQKLSAFGLMHTVTTDLDLLLQNASVDTFGSAVLALAARLQRVCALNADAALATIQLMNEGRYGIRRMIHVAIVAELILQAQQVPEAQRQVVLAAAMTSNMTMLALQDILYEQHEKMSPGQVQVMLAHPAQGVEALKALGITDPVWLEAVEQHHETIDGKGYPNGLATPLIGHHAQVLGLCDRFTALCTGRKHRPPALPSAVLKELFTDRGKGFDSDLVAMLIKVTGLYPPGSLVRLANGDIAVVVKRTMSNKQPVVKSVKSPRSVEPLASPRKHLTSEAAYAITALVGAVELGFPVDPDLLWDETFEFAKEPSEADT